MNVVDVLAQAGLTIEDTVQFWILLPDVDENLGSWAAATARDFATDAQLDGDQVPQLAAYLDAAARLERPQGFQWRFVFFVSPEIGPVLWDVAFLAPDADTSLLDLVRLGDDGQMGQQTQQFEWNAIAGIQTTRFDLDDDSPDDERAIAGRATVAVARDLPGLGQVVLCAEAQSSFLESLAISGPPLQYLLTSDSFAELVAQSSDPAR